MAAFTLQWRSWGFEIELAWSTKSKTFTCRFCLVVKSCPDSLETITHQALLSMEFPRQECWSGLPFPSLLDLPYPGIEPESPALQADYLPWTSWEAPRLLQSPCLSSLRHSKFPLVIYFTYGNVTFSIFELHLLEFILCLSLIFTGKGGSSYPHRWGWKRIINCLSESKRMEIGWIRQKSHDLRVW